FTSFLVPLPPPPRSTLFPYTTLFRSVVDDHLERVVDLVGEPDRHLAECGELIVATDLAQVLREADGAELRSVGVADDRARDDHRSEENTSALQSRGHLVCRLLLEKKN